MPHGDHTRLVVLQTASFAVQQREKMKPGLNLWLVLSGNKRAVAKGQVYLGSSCLTVRSAINQLVSGNALQFAREQVTKRKRTAAR